MNEKLNTIPCLFISFFLLSGCSGLSFSPPIVKIDDIPSVGMDGAIETAKQYSKLYGERATNVADAPVFFELPLALAGGVAAGALAFRAHPDVALASGVGAALFGIGSSYYSPRERLKIFTAASDAMACITRAAQSTKSATTVSVRSNGIVGVVSALGGACSGSPSTLGDATSQLRCLSNVLRSSPPPVAAKNGAAGKASAAADAGKAFRDALATAADRAAETASDLNQLSAEAPEDVHDAIRRVNLIAMARLQTSSTVPSFASSSSAIKTNQEAAYKLAAEMRAVREQAQAGRDAAQAAGAGTASDQVVATAEAALGAEKEAIAKLRANLDTCVSHAN